MYNSKPRTIFQSTKAVVSSTADIAVTTTTTTSELVTIGGKTISNNLKAMYASTVRENSIENSIEVEEAFDVIDKKLIELEKQLKDKGLSEMRRARIERQIKMWEETASTIETTIKL